MKRKYLPTLSELVDRLSIVQLKEVFIAEHKDEYSKEIADITHDIQILLDEQHIDDAEFWPILQDWREIILGRTIGHRGRETLDKLMPRLFAEFFIQKVPSTALAAVSKVLNQILSYFR